MKRLFIKRLWPAVIGGIFFIPSLLIASDLTPYSSDGCSLFPNGTAQQQTLWLACCEAHDKAYWLGGTRDERSAADQALKTCVAQVGEPAIAELMLAGVVVGGSPYWNTPFRWGYGWPYLDGDTPRGYKTLTAAERQLAERLLGEALINANRSE